MLNKVVSYLLVIIVFIVGVACAIPLIYFVTKMIRIDDPIIWGIGYGALGIFIAVVAYKLIQPDLRSIYENKPIFGNMSLKLYSFFLVFGISSFLLYLSISAFMATYWMR